MSPKSSIESQNTAVIDGTLVQDPTITVAVPITDAETGTIHVESEETDKKLGRSCCGCCCDMRRAVIILSILGVVFTIITIVTNYLLYFDYNNSPIYNNQPLSDDEKSTIDQLSYINTVLLCGAIVFYALAIVGAIRYNCIFLKFNIMYVIGSFIANTILFFRAADNVSELDYGVVNVIGPAVGMVMTVYANISLIKEIHCGIMSPETYDDREKQSCCCV